jgi:ActR/RegA family two-component response regulator
MKIGISTFVNDDSIDTVSLARAIEERGFESLVVRRLRRVVQPT